MVNDFRSVVNGIAEGMGGELGRDGADVWCSIWLSERGWLAIDIWPNSDGDGGRVNASAEWLFSSDTYRFGTTLSGPSSIEATSSEVEKIRSFVSAKLEEAKKLIVQKAAGTVCHY